MKNVREQGVRLLLEVEQGKFVKELLEEEVKNFPDKRDGNLLYELVYGVLQEEEYLNSCIRKLSKVPFRKIHLPIRVILQISLYQLLFLKRIPKRAIVNEAVAIAKKYGNKGSIGFVNGLLRNANPKDLGKENFFGKTLAETLSIRYSHPLFLVEEYLEYLGEDETRKLLEADNKRPPIFLRVNTNKMTREEFLKEASSIDKVEPTELSPYGVKVKHLSGFLHSPLYKEGYFYVQDLGSMKIPEILVPEKGDFILDVCAAPGGKTIAAALLAPGAKIVAGDVSKEKVLLLKENIDRLGLSNVKPVLRDGTLPDENFYDKIILDAPCSGFGLLRRKPEIRKFRTEKDIKELAKIQKKLLKTSFQCLKPGGLLCYSTCTLTREENEEVIEWFVKEERGTQVICQTAFYPHRQETDGFKISILKKRR